MQRQGMLTEERRGTPFVFLAAVLYSIGGRCIKLILWNGLSINSARNIVSLLVVGGYMALTTAANTIVLPFTAPIFAVMLVALFWGKRPALEHAEGI